MAHLIIEKDYHAFISGPSGKTAKHIAQVTGAVIEIPPSSANSEYICVSGTALAVERACGMISDIYEDMKRNCQTVRIQVPKQFHRLLVGSRGRTTKDIFEKTAVSIEMPSKKNASESITLCGEKKKLQHALQLVYEMLCNKVDLEFKQSIWTFTIAFENEKTIMDACNTQLERTSLTEFSVELKVKSHLHKFLFGKISSKKENFFLLNVRIILHVPVGNEEKNQPQPVIISGKKENVLKVQSAFGDVIQAMQLIVKDEVQVAQKYHSHFVDKRGKVLKRMSGLSEVIISFPSSTQAASDVVALEGPKLYIQKVKERILNEVNRLKSVITVNCCIEQQHHGTVIGYRGTNVKKIGTEQQVRIKFTSESDVIQITGGKKNCRVAKAKLCALVPIEVELDIPPEYYGHIIGKKGAQIKGMMEIHNVYIRIPPSTEQSNMVKIIGPKSNVERARQAMLCLVMNNGKWNRRSNWWTLEELNTPRK
ncbi:Vigilin [Halotydeus destructor]|nr:Vigilin [Halotydeus destructor]